MEKAPEKLLEEHGTPFLEKVFLKLCYDDDKGLIPDLRADSEFSNSTKRRRKSVLAGLEDINVIKGITYKKKKGNDTVWAKDTTISVRPKQNDLGFVENVSAHANKILALIIKTILFLIRTPWYSGINIEKS